jgi:glutathione S-transferase
VSLFAGVGSRVAELAQQVITNHARFEVLERHTGETLAEFKALLERLDARMQDMRLDHLRERADLLARITVLEGRLASLSEQALHAVAEKAARDLIRDGEPRKAADAIRIAPILPAAADV